jgi:hypothetical protein
LEDEIEKRFQIPKLIPIKQIEIKKIGTKYDK